MSTYISLLSLLLTYLLSSSGYPQCSPAARPQHPTTVTVQLTPQYPLASCEVWRGEETALPCVSVVGFRGATGCQTVGRRGCSPDDIPYYKPVKSLRQPKHFRWYCPGIFSLQTPTTVDNWLIVVTQALRNISWTIGIILRIKWCCLGSNGYGEPRQKQYKPTKTNGKFRLTMSS